MEKRDALLSVRIPKDLKDYLKAMGNLSDTVNRMLQDGVKKEIEVCIRKEMKRRIKDEQAKD